MKHLAFAILTLALCSLSNSAIAAPTGTGPVVFHEVDSQLTFWEAMHGNAAGPLSVPGSTKIAPNMALIKKTVFKSHDYKAVASMDWHLPYEIDHGDQFPEFKIFKSHARVGTSGSEGPGRIPEVDLFPKRRQVVIPHHDYINNTWTEVPYDIEQNKARLLNQKNEIVIHKNGMDSYNVFMNPRTEKIYALINPRAVFIYGVATDFCVYHAALGFLERGYKTYIITDAIAGIFADQSAVKLQELKDKGATLLPTEEALKEAARLTEGQSS